MSSSSTIILLACKERSGLTHFCTLATFGFDICTITQQQQLQQHEEAHNKHTHTQLNIPMMRLQKKPLITWSDITHLIDIHQQESNNKFASLSQQFDEQVHLDGMDTLFHDT
jgi:hypothetical protein